MIKSSYFINTIFFLVIIVIVSCSAGSGSSSGNNVNNNDSHGTDNGGQVRLSFNVSSVKLHIGESQRVYIYPLQPNLQPPDFPLNITSSNGNQIISLYPANCRWYYFEEEAQYRCYMDILATSVGTANISASSTSVVLQQLVVSVVP